jgi:hypothetical protein
MRGTAYGKASSDTGCAGETSRWSAPSLGSGLIRPMLIALLIAAGVLYATTDLAGIATGILIAAMAVVVFMTRDPNG